MVLDERRSSRTLTGPSSDEIGSLLWYAARTRGVGDGRLGMPWTHRAAPSAGGLHPITILISTSHSPKVAAYDPARHALSDLLETNDQQVSSFHASVREIVPAADPTILTLVGNMSKSAAAYKNSASLLWRDAGCLLATLYLCATYIDLDCCALGILGTELVAALPDRDHLVATGVCIVGRMVE
jgi:SagB-type dehydrogenase family enzyme